MAKARQAQVAPPMVCRDCRARGWTICAALSDRELADMKSNAAGIVDVPAGTDFVRQGEAAIDAYTVLDGWAMRYVLLADGGRQIIDFCLPGDFVGFQPDEGVAHEHAVQAITPVRACTFARAALLDRLAANADVAFRLAWLSHRDHLAASRHLTSVGRRSARSRLANLLLELLLRVRARNGGGDSSIALPLTQEHISDALGLTPVHVNRTLRRLREDSVVTVKDQRLIVLDFDRLAAEAGHAAPPPHFA